MYKVMIVEDEYLVVEWIKQKVDWERLGLELAATAGNGRQGLELFASDAPDIVITDLRMPVMDGISMIGEIRKLSHTARIIILTCLDEFEMARQAIEYDVTSYIMKLQSKIPDIENELEKAISWLDKNASREGSGDQDGQALPYKLKSALTYMDEHYTENIGIYDVAKQINVSAGYLGKLFARHELGTFSARLNQIRVAEAKKLLLSNHKIYEIAEMTGFMNTSYFIRIFRRLEGITPGEYRNRAR